MAKRFTASDKWDKAWFQSLSLKHKCFWIYLCDRCDIAGIWDANFPLASFSIGAKITEEDLKVFGERILKISSTKFWIADFVIFQNGEKLNEKSPVHNKIINILKSHTIKVNRVSDTLYNTLLNRVCNRAVVVVEVIEGVGVEEIVEEKVIVEGGEKPEIFLPFETERFKQVWAAWIDYRHEIKKPYRSPKSEQAALKQLSEFDEKFAIELIERSIANSYQGLVFDNTKNEYEKRKRNSGNKVGNINPDKLRAEIERLYPDGKT